MLHLSNNLKKKEKKRNVNIDLAVLPSHDKASRRRNLETVREKKEEIDQENSGVRE